MHSARFTSRGAASPRTCTRRRSSGRKPRSQRTPTREVEYAIALYNGDGVDKNEQAAAALFRKAAIRGSAIAQDRLARILATGRGAPKNPVEATKWHVISKARGETDLLLDDYVNNLDADSRAGGEKAAKVWLDAMSKPGAPAAPRSAKP